MNYITSFINYLKESESVSGRVLAYHGTPHGSFDAFSYDNRGTGADEMSFGDYGKGFYFSPRKDVALGYAKNLTKAKRGNQPYLYTVYLTMKKPFDMQVLTDYHAARLGLWKPYGNKIPYDVEGELFVALGTTQKEIVFMDDIAGYMFDNWADWDIPDLIAEEGYDSIIDSDGKEYVVFEPEQIQIIKREAIL